MSPMLPIRSITPMGTARLPTSSLPQPRSGKSPKKTKKTTPSVKKK